MTIECHYVDCEHHGTHDGEEGPFCFEKECQASAGQIIEFHKKYQQRVMTEKEMLRDKSSD